MPEILNGLFFSNYSHFKYRSCITSLRRGVVVQVGPEMQGLLADAPPLDATPPPWLAWFLAQGLLEVKLFGTPSTRFTPIRSPPWLQADPRVPPNPDASFERASQSRRV